MKARRITAPVTLEERGVPASARFAMLAVLVLLGGFGWWSSTAAIEETATAPGEIVPTEAIVRVQHRRGGLVTELLVAQGQRIESGAVLARFDDSDLRSELARSRTRLAALLKRKEALDADLAYAKLLSEQAMDTRLSELSLSRELIDAEGRIAEERDVRARIETDIAAAVLVAPASGIVHELNIRAAGEIVAPGAVVMSIVPASGGIRGELRIAPKDIGFAREGASVLVKIAAYDFGRFGGIEGRLDEISPTRLLDERGQPYFTGRVELSRSELVYKGERYPVLPGMSLSADIRIGAKTILEYLLKPVFVSAREAFRER